MKIFLILAIVGTVIGGVLFYNADSELAFSINDDRVTGEAAGEASSTAIASSSVNGIIGTSTAKITPEATQQKSKDIGPQSQLKNPPRVIKALYVTSWTGSLDSRMNELIRTIDTTEINAIVIDIKDYSGYVAYDSALPDVHKYGAEQIRMPRLNALIKKLHDKNIYVIARLSVFQDPILSKARPDLAVHSAATGGLWKDRKGITWIDASNEEAWAYNIAIAKEAASRGFDEINFDYIRFPSDGNMADMVFLRRDAKISKHMIMKKFFEYVRNQMKDLPVRTSADLFGLVTTNTDDLGIGQLLEDALPNFDAVAPMVYPSHYSAGFMNFSNPAMHPYEVVKRSVETALRRYFVLMKKKNPATSTSTIMTASSSVATSSITGNEPAGESLLVGRAIDSVSQRDLLIKIRPWLQDFNLGATYTPEMVRAQIQATYDAARTAANLPADYQPEIGWMLWSPRNVYSESALLKE